jgi:hypothetical protein
LVRLAYSPFRSPQAPFSSSPGLSDILPAPGAPSPSDSFSPNSFASAAGRSRTILFSEVTFRTRLTGRRRLRRSVRPMRKSASPASSRSPNLSSVGADHLSARRLQLGERLGTVPLFGTSFRRSRIGFAFDHGLITSAVVSFTQAKDARIGKILSGTGRGLPRNPCFFLCGEPSRVGYLPDVQQAKATNFTRERDQELGYDRILTEI